MNARRVLVRALCVGLLAGVACKKAPPDGPVDAPIDGPIQIGAKAPERWSPEALSAWVDELVPVIERHAGRRFTDRPVVEVFDPDAFEAFAKKEARLIADAIYNDTPPEIRAERAEAEGRIGSGGLFGKYGIYTRAVYLVPETIEGAARMGDPSTLADRVQAGTVPETADPADVEAFAKVVLAHELMHALQNQEHDGRELLPRLVDVDHVHGWNIVSEGGANWVALRVARELGLEDAFWILSAHQGWGRDGLDHPGAYEIWMRYGKGMDVLDTVVAKHGLDGFWRWHAAPPASTSMVFRPETYSPDVPPRALDWPTVLRGTEQALTEGVWMASNTRLGEYVLRGEAIRTGREEGFEPILAHLIDAQHLDLMRPDRTGDIRVMVFDTPENARAYLELLRAEQTEEGKLLAKALGVTVEVTYSDVRGVEGDASLLRTQRVPNGAGFIEERTAWVARGSDVVAVMAGRFRPGVRLADTLNAVFANLDAVRAGP